MKRHINNRLLWEGLSTSSRKSIQDVQQKPHLHSGPSPPTQSEQNCASARPHSCQALYSHGVPLTPPLQIPITPACTIYCTWQQRHVWRADQENFGEELLHSAACTELCDSYVWQIIGAWSRI